MKDTAADEEEAEEEDLKGQSDKDEVLSELHAARFGHHTAAYHHEGALAY